MSPKVTAPDIRAMKRIGQKIVAVTAYDYTTAGIADSAGVDIVLVGDSLSGVVMGRSSTTSVQMDQMAHHVKAARRAVKRAHLMADLPFGSYQSSVQTAVESAVTLVRAGAESVKLEGDYCEQVEAIVKAGIPVFGHVGMTPQSVNAFGGHKVQGKGDEAERVAKEAVHLEEAGVFGLVLELVPAETGKAVSAAVSVPVVGIGAGPYCDGEVQVFHDILGLGTRTFRHTKKYCEGRDILGRALMQYVEEVRKGAFPGAEQSA